MGEKLKRSLSMDFVNEKLEEFNNFSNSESSVIKINSDFLEG